MFYVVRGLSPYTEYEFYVIAMNNIGRGPPSVPAVGTTGETGKFFCCLLVYSHISMLIVVTTLTVLCKYLMPTKLTS